MSAITQPLHRTTEAGFQLNVLLPRHRERVPRGWDKLVRELEHGTEYLPSGALRLWVRSKHPAQLEHIIESAKEFPWGHEVSKQLISRYVVRTEYYALDELVDFSLNKSMGFEPTTAFIEEVSRILECERAIDEAIFQRKRMTGKAASAQEIEYYKSHGNWPEALPTTPEQV